MPRPDLRKLIAALRRHYGRPTMPPARGPFQLVLWENACYLLPDDRRAAVFEALRAQVGLTAAAIWNADQNVLLQLARMGGMQPEKRVERWCEIARITLDEFDGDLDRILEWPYPAAKSALKRFHSIGDPGAEKILMFCGVGPGLPLESNGLRVLTRTGFAREQKNYAATYRGIQEAIAGDIPRTAAARTQAHLLLRQHGQTLCKTSGPYCGECPIAPMCPSAEV